MQADRNWSLVFRHKGAEMKRPSTRRALFKLNVVVWIFVLILAGAYAALVLLVHIIKRWEAPI